MKTTKRKEFALDILLLAHDSQLVDEAYGFTEFLGKDYKKEDAALAIYSYYFRKELNLINKQKQQYAMLNEILNVIDIIYFKILGGSSDAYDKKLSELKRFYTNKQLTIEEKINQSLNVAKTLSDRYI